MSGGLCTESNDNNTAPVVATNCDANFRWRTTNSKELNRENDVNFYQQYSVFVQMLLIYIYFCLGSVQSFKSKYFFETWRKFQIQNTRDTESSIECEFRCDDCTR